MQESAPPVVQSGDGAVISTSVRSPLAELIGDVDTHNLTPRQMANLSLDFYAAGVISFEDYALLAFQPELHPDYNSTIPFETFRRAKPWN